MDSGSDPVVICKNADRNLICDRLSIAMYSVARRKPTQHIAVGTPAGCGLVLPDPPVRSEKRREIQVRQRAWLLDVLEATNRSASRLAAEAGISDTTLTRLLNNPDYTGALSVETIDRIKETFKVPGPEEYANPRSRAPGFAEAERVDLKEEPPDVVRAVQFLMVGRSAITPWRLKTTALEQAGYLPGDIVAVDPGATPEPQDAVCAQVYDFHRGSAETIWRIFDPPYLMGASNDRMAYKPLLVDNERVVIKGVIVESIRPHRLSRAR